MKRKKEEKKSFVKTLVDVEDRLHQLHVQLHAMSPNKAQVEATEAPCYDALVDIGRLCMPALRKAKLAATLSSANEEWGTPAYVFDPLHERYKFTLDVCATSKNAKLPYYFTKAHDGLRMAWNTVTNESPKMVRAWCNPPYGRGIGAWLAKGQSEVLLHGGVAVFLLPHRPGSAWWKKYVTQAPEGYGGAWLGAETHPNGGPFANVPGVGFEEWRSYRWEGFSIDVVGFRGRLRFEGAPSGAPFPSALVVYQREVVSARRDRAYKTINPDAGHGAADAFRGSGDYSLDSIIEATMGLKP